MNFPSSAWLRTLGTLAVAQALGTLLAALILALLTAALAFFKTLGGQQVATLALLALAVGRLLVYVVAQWRERSFNAAMEAGLRARGEAKCRFWEQQHQQTLLVGAQIEAMRDRSGY